MKKVLVLVPHQDDEIILCGSFLKGLVEKEYSVFIVFMTNGDYDNQIGIVRLKEALRVMELYGIPETQVVFMGYANQYAPECPHIYNASSNETVKSRFGNFKTYGLPNHPEYCYQRLGIHHLYQRKNLITDLKNIILEIMPEIILATDVEMHIDHIANSLFLDEVVGILLRQRPDFRPVIYKKQGYKTEWYAIADYSFINNPATKKGKSYAYVNHEITSFLNPYIRWEERIRIPLHKSARTARKEDNIVYKALQLYSSQSALEHFDGLLNSDSVFWRRRTNSVTYRAKVSVSSGDASYINDFKIVDCKKIVHANKWCADASIWHPESEDEKPTITFELEKEMDISEIIIYQEFCPKSEILHSMLIFDGTEKMKIGRLEKRKPTIVCFAARRVKKVQYVIEQCSDSISGVGISEIEIYEECCPQLIQIKIMIDDNFVYDYFVDSCFHEKIGVYQIFEDGSAEAASSLDKYEILLSNGRDSKKEQYLYGSMLLGAMKEEKLLLHISAKEDKNIFDEVVLYKKSIEHTEKFQVWDTKNSILLKWITLKQDKVGFGKYFSTHSYHTIAVYGLGEWGVRFIRELQDSDVKIKYVVDKNIERVSTDFPLYTPEDELEEVDVLVVTAVRSFREIEAQMSCKLQCPIVCIENVIDSLA